MACGSGKIVSLVRREGMGGDCISARQLEPHQVGQVLTEKAEHSWEMALRSCLQEEVSINL